MTATPREEARPTLGERKTQAAAAGIVTMYAAVQTAVAGTISIRSNVSTKSIGTAASTAFDRLGAVCKRFGIAGNRGDLK
jgi:hypothetical protein